MRAFMLGWEFPPHISGGLGTACHGLTRAMSRQGMKVTFVLPRPAHATADMPARVLAPPSGPLAAGAGADAGADTHALRPAPDSPHRAEPGFENITFRTVAARLLSPYPQHAAAATERWAAIDRRRAALRDAADQPTSVLHDPQPHASPTKGPAREREAADLYAGDLLAEADRYARLCVELARQERFDVIHAHDWLSFPAGLAVAGATGKPLVVHVHSTEIDRAGEHTHQPIYDIERRAMHAAVRVITVSHYTRRLIEDRYGVDPDRIDVVYNGIDAEPTHEHDVERALKLPRERIVLFLGRVTVQKGPCYFLEAASKVLRKLDDVRFIVTGSGDQMPDMIDLAARHGIGHKVHFTGFLEGAPLERVFQRAHVYVMPSVSEPFGLSAMEAIRHDVPAIVSRTSGVSEALRHVLKVDFWNTDDIADKIIAVLQRPPLAHTLTRNADREINRFTWDEAAKRCRRIYEEAIAVMPR